MVFNGQDVLILGVLIAEFQYVIGIFFNGHNKNVACALVGNAQMKNFQCRYIRIALIGNVF